MKPTEILDILQTFKTLMADDSVSSTDKHAVGSELLKTVPGPMLCPGGAKTREFAIKTMKEALEQNNEQRQQRKAPAGSEQPVHKPKTGRGRRKTGVAKSAPASTHQDRKVPEGPGEPLL